MTPKEFNIQNKRVCSEIKSLQEKLKEAIRKRDELEIEYEHELYPFAIGEDVIVESKSNPNNRDFVTFMGTSTTFNKKGEIIFLPNLAWDVNPENPGVLIDYGVTEDNVDDIIIKPLMKLAKNVQVKSYLLVPYGHNDCLDGYEIRNNDLPCGYLSVGAYRKYAGDLDALYEICDNVTNLPF